MTRLDIIRELRSWIGTPWQHQGRAKGIGCDCLGIAEAAARAADRMPADVIRDYPRRPYKDLLQKTFDAYLDRIAPEEAKIADLVLIAWKNHTVAAHVGVLSPWRHEGEGLPFGIIHAMLETGAVSEHQFDPSRINVVGYYRFRDFD